jgi:methionyl aminopeptidase
MIIKDDSQIVDLREAGRRLATVMVLAISMVKEGVTLNEIDKACFDLIAEMGDKPSFLGHMGFTKTICTSVNEVIVHGVPDDYALKSGDIIGLDMGLIHKGYYMDMARTVPVGEVSDEITDLMEKTRLSLIEAEKVLKADIRTGDIGHAVESYIEPFGYGVVKDLTGHGVGAAVWEEPSIPNYGRAGTGAVLPVGSVIAIEPMINIGGWEVEMDDEWYVGTKDKSLSAHFENTYLITEDGFEQITACDELKF